MQRIEGDFAIFPTDEGLLVLVPEGEGPVRYYFNNTSPAFIISREIEDYLTLRPEFDDSDTVHLSRKQNGSNALISTKVQ